MSISKRIFEAELLWKNGSIEGAWLLAIIAAAATARKRYPRPMRDKESFTRFIRDETSVICSGSPKPSNHKGLVVVKFADKPFEDVLYKDYRCALIHEASLDGKGFSKPEIREGIEIETLSVGSNTYLPSSWVLNLLRAIKWASENSDEFE